MLYGILGTIVFILDIVAIISIIQSGLAPLMKLVWVVLVLALPLIGMALWFILGERKGLAA